MDDIFLKVLRENCTGKCDDEKLPIYHIKCQKGNFK